MPMRHALTFLLAYLATSDAQENSTAKLEPRPGVKEVLSALGVQPFGTGYDASSAPNNNYGTGKVTADVKYALVDVMDIDEKHGMIELMQQTSVLWSDSRLAFSETKYKGLAKLRIQANMVDFDIGKVFWIPKFDTLFEDKKVITTEKISLYSTEEIARQKAIPLKYANQVEWEITYQVTFRNMPSMNHGMFPFDVIRLHWRALGADYVYDGTNKLDMLDYRLVKSSIPTIENSHYIIHNDEKELALFDTGILTSKGSGNKKAVIGVDIVVSRQMFGYFTKNIIPLAMSVMVGTCSFWISPAAVPARTGFGVTMVLVGITQQQALVAELPKISYLTWMDIYGYLCLFYLIMPLLIFAYVHSRLVGAEKAEAAVAKQMRDTAVNADVRSRTAMPISFIIIFLSMCIYGIVLYQFQMDQPIKIEGAESA